MDESRRSVQCFTSEMTAALGPYDEFIDILAAENFCIWHNTAGLRCLVCEHPVEVYRSSRKNPYVHHGKGHGAHASAAERKTAGETFLHRRFRYWVCHELRQRGVDAAVEVWQDGRRPDVSGTDDQGRSYAVEIQWSSLSFEDARARTEHHRDATGAEVLRLTRACSWVEKLPALGVKSFTPTAGGHYFAHTGHLRPSRRAVLGVEPIAIRSFFEAWIDGELASGYRDTEKAGWATVVDWTTYTAEQADDIAALRRDLKNADTRVANQAKAIRIQGSQIKALEDANARYERDLDARTAERDAAAGERDNLSESITSATRRITEISAKERQALTDLGDTRQQLTERENQLREVTAALAARGHYLKILLFVALVLALAAVTGWV